MMEPEFRMESNEKGFCNHHCSMLFDMSNKLALSLMLDTHLEEIRKKLDTLKKSASALKNQKGGLFKKTGSADFAKALSGNDPEKADLLLDAFKKGFKEATKSWGQDLPDISQRTYDAVVEKFNKWKNGTEETEAAQTQA